MTLSAELSQLAAGFSGTVGLWARSLESDEIITFGAARDPFPSASVIKVPVLYELFRQEAEGRFALLDTRRMQAEDQVPGAGVLKDLTPGTAYPILDLATLMIIISDNTASNMCIDLVGADNVTRSMAALGLPGLQLHNKFFKAVPGRPRNQATPAELGMLVDRIVRNEVLTPAACDQMVGIMKRTHNPMVTRFLPEYTSFRREGALPVTIASKAGAIEGCRHEVAAVWKGGRGYVVSIMTRDCKDLRYHTDNEGELLVGQIARVIDQHFTGA